MLYSIQHQTKQTNHAATPRQNREKKHRNRTSSSSDVSSCSTPNTWWDIGPLWTHALVFLLTLTPSLRLHLEQTGCSPDAALWKRLHCDEGASGSSRGRRAVQVPLREAENVRRRWNTQPLPWLWGSRGGNGKERSCITLMYDTVFLTNLVVTYFFIHSSRQ